MIENEARRTAHQLVLMHGRDAAAVARRRALSCEQDGLPEQAMFWGAVASRLGLCEPDEPSGREPTDGQRVLLSPHPFTEPLFIEAGWDPHAHPDDPDAAALTAEQSVLELLKRYGGLRVGGNGPGSEVAATDVRFEVQYRSGAGRATAAWFETIGRCERFASAAADHMALYLNDAGVYFALTCPDGRLYELGDSFGGAMRKLLFGQGLGTPLAEDDLRHAGSGAAS